MRIMILGGDGYLGWPTAMAFRRAGHEVLAVDNYFRRRIARETKSDALIPTPLLTERAAIFHQMYRPVDRDGRGRLLRLRVPLAASSPRSSPTRWCTMRSSPPRPIR